MPPGLPQVWGAFSPGCTFKISRYAADDRHLVAYEIIAQGWKKRLDLGVGGGGDCILKIIIAKGGGGTIFICNYFLGGGGLSFDTSHFSDLPPPPLPGK